MDRNTNRPVKNQPTKRCAAMVWPRGRFYMPVPPSRCSRKAAAGSKFCRQHGRLEAGR
jgi:hypothetical protein